MKPQYVATVDGDTVAINCHRQLEALSWAGAAVGQPRGVGEIGGSFGVPPPHCPGHPP